MASSRSSNGWDYLRVGLAQKHSGLKCRTGPGEFACEDKLENATYGSKRKKVIMRICGFRNLAFALFLVQSLGSSHAQAVPSPSKTGTNAPPQTQYQGVPERCEIWLTEIGIERQALAKDQGITAVFQSCAWEQPTCAEGAKNWSKVVAVDLADLASVQAELDRCLAEGDSGSTDLQPLSTSTVDNQINASRIRRSEEATRCMASQQQVANSLESQIRTDQGAISNLGFGHVADAIADWEGLAADARAEFAKQTLNSILDLVGAAAESAVENGAKLYPINVNDFIQQHKIENQTVADALYKLALKNRSDPLWDSRVLSQIKMLGAGKDLVFMDDLSAVLSQALNLAGFKQYALLMSDLQFTASAIYNNVTRRVSIYEINQLTSQAETSLKALQVLSATMKRHVDSLKLANTLVASCRSATVSTAVGVAVSGSESPQADWQGANLATRQDVSDSNSPLWEMQLQQERLKALSENNMDLYNKLVAQDLDIYRQHRVDPCDSAYFKEGCQH